MMKSILGYGLAIGAAVISTTIVTLAAGVAQEWLGFLVMFVAFGTIFVAVKKHRDNELGGVISFGGAVAIGLGITVVAAIVYVVVWEVYLLITDYAFIENYTNALIESQRAAGASAEELEAATAQALEIKAQYGNPWFRLPMTFVEIAPVGVLVSLVAATALRRSPPSPKA